MRGGLVSESLTSSHACAAFDSGEPALDDWLRQAGLHAQAMRTARTFVWHRGDGAVLAYFSLAAHVVRREEAPSRIAHGAPHLIPAILIARLALHRSLQGQGLGGELLWDALTRVVAASNIAGVRLVVVEALHEGAAAFYLHHGFRACPGNPSRLVQSLGHRAGAVRVSQPPAEV